MKFDVPGREQEQEQGIQPLEATEVETLTAPPERQQQFTSAGALPPVQDEMPAPPQPSASERAFGAHEPHAQAHHHGPAQHGALAASAQPALPESPVLATEQRRTVHGVTVIAPPGTHAGALDMCAEFINLEIGRNEFAQKKLAEARTTIVIIPGRTPMTSVSQFQGLAGKHTFDGRDWSTVRGSGGTAQPDGTFAIGVAEENLIAVRGIVSKYPTGYSIGMHEFAHALESHGLTAEQHHRLEGLYKNHSQRDPHDGHGTFTDTYAASNLQEYFAQCTNAFFGRNVGGTKAHPNQNGKLALYQNDPDMYAFLVEIYETNHDADGKRVDALTS